MYTVQVFKDKFGDDVVLADGKYVPFIGTQDREDVRTVFASPSGYVTIEPRRVEWYELRYDRSYSFTKEEVGEE